MSRQLPNLLATRLKNWFFDNFDCQPACPKWDDSDCRQIVTNAKKLNRRFLFAVLAQKSHVKPRQRPKSTIKIAKPNKPERLQAKNKFAKVCILVSLNLLK